MEITPNQIRTGNLFEHFVGLNGEHFDWLHTALDWQDIRMCEENKEAFNRHHYPIELSEFWLEYFSFEAVDDDGLWGHPDNELFQIQCEYLQEPNSFAHVWDTAFTDAPLKYVHQLQNLYFSLTGIELSAGEKV